MNPILKELREESSLVDLRKISLTALLQQLHNQKNEISEDLNRLSNRLEETQDKIDVITEELKIP